MGAEQNAEVEQALTDFFSAVDDHRLDEVRAFFAPEFELIHDGQRFDRETFLATFEQMTTDGIATTHELSDCNTGVMGDVAYTSYLIRNTNDGSEFLESVVLRRSTVGWQQVLVHVTRLKD